MSAPMSAVGELSGLNVLTVSFVARDPKRTYVALIGLHQPRRPADANKKTVRSAYAHLVKTPFAMT